MKLYSEKIEHNCFLYNYAREKGIVTSSVREASYLLLPFAYESIFGNQEDSYNCYNINEADFNIMHRMALQYDALSKQTGKQLIVFFDHDADISLPFFNAIIFRTSWLRSKREKNVFGMPAFIDSLPKNTIFQLLNKNAIPQVTFRGQLAPLQLPFKTGVRVGINHFLKCVGISYRLKLWYDEKLLLRRSVIKVLKKAGKKINLDLGVQGHYAAHAHPQKADYLKSLAENSYVVCIAGWGNYSYRFYETLREGRIPVFVDTDCLLPCADEIDWEAHVIWIKKERLAATAKSLIKFHKSISAGAFEKLQADNSTLYHRYFTKQGFAGYVCRFLEKLAVGGT